MLSISRVRFGRDRAVTWLHSRGLGVPWLIAHIPVLAVLAATTAMILVLAANSGGLTFFYDEWAFMDRGITDLLRPHNEHLVAGLVLIHRGIAAIFGKDSYVPFLVVLWGCHALAVSGVFAVLREVATERQAAAGTMVFALLGAGWENLLWAFQIGFVLSTALGCWALAVMPRRPVVAAALLTGATITSGVGLFYVAATLVRAIGSRQIAWLAAPIAVFGVWTMAYGVSKLGSPDWTYMVAGITAAAAGLVGGNVFIGGALIAVAAPLLRPDRMTLAAVAGLAAMYLSLALVRSDLGPAQAVASRYVYVAAPLMLILALSWWRALATRMALGSLGLALVVIAIAGNLLAFQSGRAVWTARLAAEAKVPVEARDPTR